MSNADCPFTVKVSVPDLNIRKAQDGYSEDREVYRSWRVYYCRSEKW